MTNQRRGPLSRPERYGSYPEAPYWPRLIEKLLLSFIEAYSSDEERGRRDWLDRRQERLDAAMKILFGVKPRRGPKMDYDLAELLRAARGIVPSQTFNNVATAFHWNEREQVPKVRPTVRSTTEVTSNDSQIRRIGSKISDEATSDYLSFIVNGNWHEEEDIQQALVEIREILHCFNVDMDLDPVKLGMASLWQGQPE